jgi:hypothetical protein
MTADHKWFRFALATLAYRATGALRDAPDGLAEIRLCDESWTALQTVAHLGDVIHWAAGLASGDPTWTAHEPGTWDAEVTRFYAGLARLDELAASGAIECDLHRLFGGPVADALTHVGQLATMRRVAGSPVPPQSYFHAEISIGRVGADQWRAAEGA